VVGFCLRGPPVIFPHDVAVGIDANRPRILIYVAGSIDANGPRILIYVAVGIDANRPRVLIYVAGSIDANRPRILIYVAVGIDANRPRILIYVAVGIDVFSVQFPHDVSDDIAYCILLNIADIQNVLPFLPTCFLCSDAFHTTVLRLCP
jgi:hypothetical protein